MVAERIIPENPLLFIKCCIERRKMRWTYHAHMRLKGRFISRDSIIGALDSFEIIEVYPEDKYLPSYLIRGEKERGVFHVLIAIDVPGDNVRMITAYEPDRDEWENDSRTRRTIS